MTRHSAQDQSSFANSARPKNPTPLTPSLDKNLFSYALVATSAGVALLASAQPAEASVVVTKTSIVVPINGGPVYFDINGDGVPDFGLSANAVYDCPTGGERKTPNARPPLGCFFGGHLSVLPTQTANEVEGSNGCADALGKASLVGGAGPFVPGRIMMGGLTGTGSGSNLACSWLGDHPGPFLGVKFTDTDQNVHYGFVQVAVKERGTNFTAKITAYGYETTPNQPIAAGAIGASTHADATQPEEIFTREKESATLGRLAQGAAGLTAWRRDEEVVAA
jgi:hypothetical protein